MTNALKYSPAASIVRIHAYQTAEHAVLAVTDHGVAIDADELPRLFEKHFRARTAGTTAGTGLGLYGRRLIVEAHGGRLEAHSAPGVGSTFIAAFPRSELTAS